MKLRPKLGCFLVALLCSCSKHSPPPAVAVAGKTAAPQFAIRPLPDSESKEANSSTTPAKSTWQIQVAEFNDEQIEDLGLKALFQHPLHTNANAGAELADSPVFQFAQGQTNVRLAVRSGAYAGVCSDVTASNLLEKCSRTARVDLLTTPPLVLIRTNEGQIAVQDALSIVVPGSGSKTEAQRTKRLSFGQVFNLQIGGMQDGAALVDFAAWIEEFNGYSQPAKSSAANGESEVNLGLALLSARTALSGGDALLLGSIAEDRLVQTIDRPVFFSDIPLIGKMFVRKSASTNHVRQLVILRRVGGEG